ncbi:MAG: hypothetical protein QOF84_4715 [Streptomyces sp.]|nr:hypothetical protein [Streptomyces sp.]
MLANRDRHVDEWLPIRDWTTSAVREFCDASDIAHHWAYDSVPGAGDWNGSTRSCSICIMANRSDLILAVRRRPRLTALYAQVEQVRGHRFRQDLSIAELLQLAQRRGGPAPRIVLADDGPEIEELSDPVAIEMSRGLLVACLRATKRPVYAINPMAASRYRDRHAVARKKSDHLDAMVLANTFARTGPPTGHCPTTANSPRPSPSSPGPSRTRSGTAPRPAINSAHTCASTSPVSSPPSSTTAKGCAYPSHASSWPPLPPRPMPPSSPAPSCGRC